MWKAPSSDDKTSIGTSTRRKSITTKGSRLLSDPAILKGIEQIKPLYLESDGALKPMIEERAS